MAPDVEQLVMHVEQAGDALSSSGRASAVAGEDVRVSVTPSGDLLRNT
jgi:hypothetical protein